MDYSQLLILIGIGIAAGMLSGFIGIGGGVVIVPALIYFMGLTQFQAQGTSLAVMLPPAGIMAFMNYYKADQVNVKYAVVVALTFIIGGYFGSKIALRLNENAVKLIFGVLMFYVSVRMVWSAGFKIFIDHGNN